MKVDLYEKIWMWGISAMLALFFATTAWAAYFGAMMPPSHVETIDPATLPDREDDRATTAALTAKGRVSRDAAIPARPISSAPRNPSRGWRVAGRAGLMTPLSGLP